MKLGKHQSSIQKCHCLCYKVHSRVLRSLCMHYVTKTFLLVSSSVRSEQLLCFVHGQGQKTEDQKHTTKNFVEFHNHSRFSKYDSNVWQFSTEAVSGFG